MALVYIVIWVLLALIPGFAARKRGFSFPAYFLHGLFPSFITALITLRVAESVSKNRAYTNGEGSTRIGNRIGATTTTAIPKPTSSDDSSPSQEKRDTYQQLEDLFNLKLKGILTEQEYLEKKAKLLSRI
jgi:hypothetical protein